MVGMRQHIGVEGCSIENAHHRNVGGTGSKGFLSALNRVHPMDGEQDACVGNRDDGYRDEQH